MTRTDILLIVVCILALARIVQAWAYHRQRQEQGDVGFSMIVDYLDAIKERLGGDD